MGWFDEQIRERIKHDDEAFADAFASMAGVVMGERIARALKNDRMQAKNAIEEILKFYHIRAVELPEGISDINDQLEYLMRPSGIMHRTVNLEGEWYKNAFGAMLGSRNDNGMPVALLPNGISGYRFYDVQSGKYVKLNKNTASLINSEALCFYRPLPPGKLSIKGLWIYIAKCISRQDVITVGAASLAVALIGTIIPRLHKLIYGTVIDSRSLQLLFAVFGCLICVSLSQLLIGVIRQLVLSRFGSKMNIQVQAACMMRLMSLPASFFKDYAAGDLAGRVNAISQLCAVFADSILSAALTGLFSLVYITQMVSFAPKLALPGLLVIFSMVIVSVTTTIVQFKVSRQQLELAFKEAGLEYALITGVQKIKLAGAEKRAFSKWAGTYTAQARFLYAPPVFIRLARVFSSSILLVGTAVIYYCTIKANVSLSDYYAFNSAYSMIMGAFITLTDTMGQFAQITPVVELMRPILEGEPEISENKHMVTKLNGGIELNNVSFRYTDDGPQIIDNLSLKIKPGQYVAIVGSTGCGKSTLMRLMLGFETPQKGAIYYDGRDLESLDLRSLRRNIGTVMQDGRLFQGDIYSNIVISAPQLGMDAAWEAAEMAGVADDIRAMPMGMYTVIAEGVGGISGGQKQRLMIARAIANKPRILMFDEATSALDNITQKIVSESLDSLQCTRIVIAHRLSTIKHCNRIIVLDKGRIVEDGSYDELIAQGGFFSQLVERQRVDFESK